MPDPIYDAAQARQLDYDEYLERRARFEPITLPDPEPRTKHGLTEAQCVQDVSDLSTNPEGESK